MPRVSQPIEVTAEERAHLTSLLEHADANLAERIRIVLACADEPSNKKVAALLDADEHKVAKWKEAFRKDGIWGLENSGRSGRKPTRNMDAIEAGIFQLLQDANKTWTVHAIAQELGISDYYVRNILSMKGIMLERKRQWTYETTDTVCSADIEVIGIYIACSACIILTCYHPYGVQTAHGIFTTTNRELAEKLEHADYQLSVGDVIAETQRYHHITGGKLLPEAFIGDWVKSIAELSKKDVSESDSAMQYRLFVWGQEPIQLKKTIPVQVQMVSFESTDALLAGLHSWAGSITSAAHLYELELLKLGIESYLKHAVSDSEPFCWTKTVTESGTAANQVMYQPWKETKPQSTIEDWLQVQEEIEDSKMQAGLIAFVRSSNGVTFRPIERKDTLPTADQFSFESEEGFMKGMNLLEQAVLQMRDEAGLAAVDLYMDQVKKNKNLSGS